MSPLHEVASVCTHLCQRTAGGIGGRLHEVGKVARRSRVGLAFARANAGGVARCCIGAERSACIRLSFASPVGLQQRAAPHPSFLRHATPAFASKCSTTSWRGIAPHRRISFYSHLALLAAALSLFGTAAPACTLAGNDFTLKVAAGSLLAFEGDSLTYGYDTTPTGQQPALNGSAALRSKAPFPEGVAAEADGALTVENRGFPGDRTIEGLQRWATVRPARVVFIQYGTNDFGNFGGFPSGPLSLDDFSKNLRDRKSVV